MATEERQSDITQRDQLNPLKKSAAKISECLRIDVKHKEYPSDFTLIYSKKPSAGILHAHSPPENRRCRKIRASALLIHYQRNKNELIY